jgi:hypothetical protein
VTIEEVNTAIKQLNTNKAHDYFGLTAENFIHAINQLIEHLKQLINLFPLLPYIRFEILYQTFHNQIFVLVGQNVCSFHS